MRCLNSLRGAAQGRSGDGRSRQDDPASPTTGVILMAPDWWRPKCLLVEPIGIALKSLLQTNIEPNESTESKRTARKRIGRNKPNLRDEIAL